MGDLFARTIDQGSITIQQEDNGLSETEDEWST